MFNRIVTVIICALVSGAVADFAPKGWFWTIFSGMLVLMILTEHRTEILNRNDFLLSEKLKTVEKQNSEILKLLKEGAEKITEYK